MSEIKLVISAGSTIEELEGIKKTIEEINISIANLVNNLQDLKTLLNNATLLKLF
jgi:archaellum component FlaC